MQYDVIVLGAGQAAPGVAVYYAENGHKVALIEGDKLGGTCLNYGCRPTKTLRASAHVAHIARRGAEYGVNTGDIRVDFQAVMARKDDIIGGMQDGFWEYMQGVENLDIIKGYGRFAGKDGDAFRVEVNGETHTAPKVYINTGTRTFIPPIEGIDTVPYMTNKDILALDSLPKHLVIIGGGYIGLEFGQMFRRFGSEVTIIEASSHIANREDEDISEAIAEILREEGITILTDHKAQRVSQDASGKITVSLDGDTQQVAGSHLLMAVGRKPNTDQLNLESIGLETTQRGIIETNGHFETAVAGIWALGDVNGRGAFTHTSYQDQEILLDNLKGGNRSADGRIMAYAMFVDPPYGRVGMNEREARESGRNVLMAVHPMKNNSRARLDSNTQGLVKVLVDADSEEILGAMILGVGGDEVVQIFSAYMHTGASYKILRDALPIHPTVAEFIPTWLGMLEPLEDQQAEPA